MLRAVVLFALLAAASASPFIRPSRHIGALNARLTHLFEDGKLLDVQDGPQPQYMTQNLDHFDPTSTATFQQKFYVNDQYWAGPGSPVFFMLGGEGPVSNKYVTDHFIVGQYAQKFGGLVVALEHRFYGETLPFGSNSTAAQLKFLSSQQALADAALFRQFLAEKYATPTSKWIVFGGSYSGNLSAWLKLKYPQLFAGAISASAPLLAELDFNQYFQVVANSIGGACASIIGAATQSIQQSLHTPSGRLQLASSAYFNTCTPIQSDMDTFNFVGDLYNAIAGIVQYNDDNVQYQPFDMTVMCEVLGQESDPVMALVNFINVYNNATSSTGCMDISYFDFLQQMTPTSDAKSWTWQTCTEFGYYQTGDAPNQPFSSLITLQGFLTQCQDIFSIPNMTPNIDFTNTYYGALNIATTNTVFTNGGVDPWHALGLDDTGVNAGEGTVQVFIPGTAHCAPLYPPTSNDLPALTAARQVMLDSVTAWLGGN